DRRRTAAVGAHAERDLAGVAVNDLDLLHRDPELVGHELRERRLVALPMGMRAGVNRHAPRRMHAHLAGLVEAGARAERAHELRRRDGAGFDVRREPDADEPPLLARGLLLGAELLVVEEAQELV